MITYTNIYKIITLWIKSFLLSIGKKNCSRIHVNKACNAVASTTNLLTLLWIYLRRPFYQILLCRYIEYWDVMNLCIFMGFQTRLSR